MSNNNSNDLFSKMLGTTPTSINQPQEKSGESSDNTEKNSAQSEKTVNSTSVSSQEKKQTFAVNNSEHKAFNLPVASSSPVSKKKSVDVKKVSEKINIKLVAGIAIALIVVIVLSYVGLGVVLPAKTNASKIRKDFLDSEISSIYASSIEGNGLREKIFVDSLKNYPKDVKKAYENDEITYDRAISIFSALKSTGLFDDAKISESRERVETLEVSKRAFSSGEQLFAQGKFNDAIVQFAKVVKEDNNYGKAQDYISQCGAKYKETVLSSATSALSLCNYDDALQLLTEASQVLPNDSDISTALEKAKIDYAAYLKKNALENGNTLINERKYQEALSLVNAALERNANDSELSALLNLAKSEYVSNVISRVNAFLTDYDYTNAANVLSEALEVLPNNSELINKKTEIEKNKPASLTELIMINNSGWKWNEGTPKDPFGTDYSTSNNYVILEYIDFSWEHDKYGEFRAYKKYSRLTGRVAPYQNMSENGSVIFQVFADDQLVYTSPEITRKTDAFTFNINIENADYIKIVTEVDSEESIILSELSVCN